MIRIKPNWIVVICLFILNVAFLNGQTDPQQILNRYLDQRDAQNGYVSNVDMELKFYSMEDTSRFNANVEIIRDQSDSLFGGLLYFELDSLIFSYTGDKLIRIDKKTWVANIADPKVSPYTWISSTWVNNFVEYGFLTRNPGFRSLMTNPGLRTVTVDTIIEDWPCKGYFIYMPDEGEFTKQSAFVAIDTIEFMMRKRTTSSWFQENEQYIGLTYHQPYFNSNTTIPTQDSNFLSAFQIEEEIMDEEPDAGHDIVIDYSSLSGKVFGKAETFVLSDVKADLIILDFWYSSCYPCIKTIPVVNALYNQFKDKNVKVFGVNIIDDEVKSKSRMEKYIRNNPMAYETIMADAETYVNWVPNGYPTLLILDQNYELLLEHTGFTETMTDEMTTFIQSYLIK